MICVFGFAFARAVPLIPAQTTGEMLFSLGPHGSDVLCLAIVDDVVTSSARDGSMCWWDLKERKRLCEKRDSHDAAIFAMDRVGQSTFT
jgi:hypothetical protein